MSSAVQWENIRQEPAQAGHLQRARVPGGWLVRETQEVIHDRGERGLAWGYDWRIAMTYVPDPDGAWLNELEQPK